VSEISITNATRAVAAGRKPESFRTRDVIARDLIPSSW
jgi:hypothetical protein